MPFHLITGNRLEVLLDQLNLSIVSNLSDNPFNPIEIIVPSRGMGRWVSLQLAQKNEISANIKLMYQMEFIEHSFMHTDNEINEGSLNAQKIAWKIRLALPDLINHDSFESIKNYINSDSNSEIEPEDFEEQTKKYSRINLKNYQLTNRIGELFDNYLVYRPQWILDWDQNQTPEKLKNEKQEVWQHELWKKITAHKKQPYFPDYLNSISNKDDLFTYSFFPKNWKNRIIRIFGFSSLPQGIWRFFHKLSENNDIYFYYFSPSQEYWADTKSRKQQIKELFRAQKVTNIEISELESSFIFGNQLLGSFGKNGKDFLSQILNSENIIEQECYEDPGSDSILHQIQQDILNNEPIKEENENEEIKEKEFDQSVQIFSCYSPLREVEVMYDELLRNFEQNSNLQPSDIFVMSPTPEIYAPLIESIFNIEHCRKIPISITDSSPENHTDIIESVINILELTRRRIGLSEVFKLLENQSIAQKFKIPIEKIPTLYKWAKDSGIRWGIDEKSHQNFCDINFKEVSWAYGFDKMIAGYAMQFPGEKIENIELLDQKIFPFDQIEGKESLNLGNFIDFFETLQNEIKYFQQHSFADSAFWYNSINTMMNKMFNSEDIDSVMGMQTVRSKLYKMYTAVLYGQKELDNQITPQISIEIIIEELKELLSQNSFNNNFLKGHVTFCKMTPMRSIPAQTIYLLGMNYGVFPRQNKTDSFNLMKKFPEPGDRCERDEDRQLFLEALLSARDRLYISYIGKDVQSNKEKPESTVVRELISYIEERFVDKQCVRVNHPLQPFNSIYYKENPYPLPQQSFSKINCQAAESLNEQIPELNQSGYKKAYSEPLSPIEQSDKIQISIDDLISFFKNPLNEFLKKRLNINTYDNLNQLKDDSELFKLDSAYTLHEKILFYLIQAKELKIEQDCLFFENLKNKLQSDAFLPLGKVGDDFFAKTYKELDDFAKSIPLEKYPKKFLNINSDQWTLSGTVDIEKQVIYRYTKIKGKDRLNLMIRHLASCAVEETITLGYFQKNKKSANESIILSSLLKNDATEKITKLCQIYIQGLTQPLKFFPETSWAYFNNKKDKEQAAQKTWKPSYLEEFSESKTFERGFDSLVIDDSFIELSQIYNFVQWGENNDK